VKRETKIYQRESQDQSEGSFWELCLFAIFFVVVFTVVARAAHAAPVAKTSAAHAPLAKVAAAPVDSASASSEPKKAAVGQQTTKSKTATPIHLQTLPSAIPSAAVPDANVAAALPEPSTKKRFAWTSSLILDTSASLNREEATSYSGEYLMKTGVTDQKSNIAALLKFGYDREYSFDLDDGTDGDFVDPSVAVTKTWKNGVEFVSPVFDTIVVGISSTGGASHASARRTFVASVGPSIGATKKIHKLTIGQKFGYQRRFYNYDIRDDGTVNAPDSFSSTTDLSFDITPSLALSAETLLAYAINYQGTGETTEWSSFSIDYTISDLLGASLGVATKRGTSSPDGTYNEVKFYDGSVAQGFFDLILNF
jgi:hypothetical protein